VFLKQLAHPLVGDTECSADLYHRVTGQESVAHFDDALTSSHIQWECVMSHHAAWTHPTSAAASPNVDRLTSHPSRIVNHTNIATNGAASIR
jgi:hypothetical protein